MSDTSVFPIILIIERERGRLQGLTLKAELENRDNPKKLFCNDNPIYYQYEDFCNFFIRTKKIHTKYNESLNIHLKSHYKISNITL